MLTLPSVDEATGQLSHQLLPLNSDSILNASHTGTVVLVDTSGSSVQVTMPSVSEVENSSIYFTLVAGSNALDIVGQDSDTVDSSSNGIRTTTQWSVVLLRALDSNWAVDREAGTWTTITTTTT